MKGRYLSIAFHATVFTVLLSAFAYVGLVWYLGTLPGEEGRAAHLTANEEIVKTGTGTELQFFDMQWNAEGKPMISYMGDAIQEGKTVYTLNFAEYIGNNEGNCFTGSNWNCERILSGFGMAYPRIGLNKANRPIVAFRRTNQGNTTVHLSVADYVGGGVGNCEAGSNWNCTDLMTSPLQGAAVVDIASLKRTMSGNPIIAYGVKNPFSLSFTEYVGGGSGSCLPGSDWNCTVLEADANSVFQYIAMAVDTTGRPIISYSKRNSQGNPAWALKMAQYVGQGGNCGNGIWSCEEVNNPTGEESSTLTVTSIDSNASGQPVISYTLLVFPDDDLDYYSLKYAFYVGSGGNCTNEKWNCGTIDNLGSSGGTSKIMRDPVSQNIVVGYHIRILRTSYYSIKYGEYIDAGRGNCFAGSNWNCEVLITNTMPTPRILQMEFDTQGLPAFSYIRYIDVPNEPSLRQLLYATTTAVPLPQPEPQPTPPEERETRRVPESSAPPQPVIGLSFESEGTTARLSWQDPPSFTLDHIEILRNYNPLPEVVTGDAYAIAEKGQEMFTESNLVLGNTYKYIVRSVNGYGSYVNSEEIVIEMKEEETKEEEIMEEEAVGGEKAVEAPPVEEEPQGTLVVSSVYKAVGIPDVYYIASNGKRYVFPGEDVYKSWYRDFDVVKEVDVREFAFYPLAGIVTYRPGLQLIKIATEPKVYVLEKGGVLRWIVNEGVASELFGRTWDNRIVVVDAALFVHYRRGNNIASAADYSIPEGVSEAGCGEGETALTGTCALVEEGIPSEAPIVFVPTLEKEGIAPVSVIPTSSVFLWLVRLLTIVLFIVIFSMRVFFKDQLSRGGRL